VSAVSLAWLRSNPNLSAPIASARTVEQLEEIVQVVDLDQSQIDALNAVSA
jgi:aryl-alcohol dehydrogenase-like predicted oxidoreductase